MRRRGFTTIETLVAVTLASLLAGGGTLLAAALAGTFRLAATARTLAQTLRETRARAMAEGEPLEVAFDAAAGAWSVRTLDGTIRRAEALPAPVWLVSVPASARIRFEPTGTAANGTVVLGASTAARRHLIVNQRGRVRLA